MLQAKQEGVLNMKQTILVTGATGYIGRHVIEALTRKGANVIAVDRVDAEFPTGVQFVKDDIFSDRAISYSFQKIHGCIHLAWQDGFNHNAESHLANLSSHFRFLQKIVSHGVERITVMGSMHEVGYWEGAITEDTPCRPLSYYGIAKNALRQALTVFLKDKSTQLQWLRGYYIYGDDKANHSIFTKLLEAAAAGKKTFPFTSGKNKYDFIRVSQLSDMIATTALQDKVLGIINVCSGLPRSLAEVVEGFIRDHHLDIKLEYGAFPDRPYDSPGVWGDATKINAIMAEANY